MIETIYNILSALSCPVRYGWYDEAMNEQHITYYVVSDSTDEFEDDEEATLHYVIQVDVWSREDDSKIIKQIKQLMKANGFVRMDSVDLFEVDTKIYHKAIRFNFNEEV